MTLPTRGPRPSSIHQGGRYQKWDNYDLTISKTMRSPAANLGTSWALALPTSSPAKPLGHTGSYTKLCQEPLPPLHLKWPLGSLSLAAILYKISLPARNLALTPGSGSTCQWVGSTPVFSTLTPCMSEPALALGLPRVLQPATSWPDLH